METLVLMRHAKAVREHEAPSDRARGLTDRGRDDARAAGKRLADLGLRIDRVVISPSQRTRETADQVLAAFPGLIPTIAERLYMAGPDALFDEAAATGGEAVLVIAHNPGLQELVEDLVRQSGDHSKLALQIAAHFPTSAFAAFSVAGDTADAAGPRLIAAHTPADP